MKIRVVCISRSIAAGGEAVGEVVARRLGFRYVDEEIISRAANQAQVDAAVVAAAEQRKSLLERLLDKLPTAHDVAGAVTLSTGVPVDIFTGGVVEYRAVPEDMRALIRAAIHEVAQAGQAVIVPPGRKHGFHNCGTVTLHIHAILAAPIFEAMPEGATEMTRRWSRA